MNIFNSLGSNYSWKSSLRDLFTLPSSNSKANLSKLLSDYYGGQATLTYKGREALELGFKRSKLPAGSLVGISGFTCYVVYQAIVNAGYKPVFIDTGKKQIQFSLDELQAAYEKNPQLKAIVVQNTLGLPADMLKIGLFCKQHDIKIVEDLAHSTGAVYADGKEAGKIGDFIMLSFSQDKPLDATAGGVLIDKQSGDFQQPMVPLWQRLKIRCYPFLTGLIRGTYGIGLGRVLHLIFKKLHIMARPMDSIDGLHTMGSATAKIIGQNWQNRDQELAHRRQIAEVYQQNIDKALFLDGMIGEPSYLRFPIVTEKRDELIAHLKSDGIYLGDTWYDAPIGPKKYMSQTNYRAGSCPNAEKLASQIVNLPTHRHVTPEIALSICAKIKQWQASQQPTK